MKEATITRRRLSPEVVEKIIEVLKEENQKGYGYMKALKRLRENGIEISESAVRYYYYKLFPERIGTGKRFLPRELRIKIYEEVQELKELGIGYRRIWRKIKELYGVAPSLSTILTWCKGKRSPYNGSRMPSIDFLKPSPALAYIIGVVAGDGWAIIKRTNIQYIHYDVGASVKDKEFIDEFASCLGKVLNRWPPRPIPLKNGKFVVRIGSKILCDLLKKPINIDKISRFVEHCEDCIRSFLKGFFDSEGHVQKGKGNIYCYNTDIKLLKYVQKLLHQLGIKTSGPYLVKRKGTIYFNKKTGRTYKANKDCYILYIKSSSRLKFHQLVNFTIKRKRQRLIGYCLPRELRIRIYEKTLELRQQGLSYRRVRKKIEDLYGVTVGVTTIYNWCKGLHIPFAARTIKVEEHREKLEFAKDMIPPPLTLFFPSPTNIYNLGFWIDYFKGYLS